MRILEGAVERPSIQIKTLAIVFLAALICLNTATTTGAQIQEKIDPELLSFLSLNTEYVVDDVLELLNSFSNTVASQLDDLDAHLNNELASLEKLIAQKEERLSSHQPACDRLSVEEEFRQRELERVSTFVNWISDSVERNNALIRQLYDERCLSHIVYIEFIQNAKYFLRLLEVLKAAVEAFDFVQIGYLGNALEDMMSDVSISDEAAVTKIFTQLQKVRELTREAEYQNQMDAMQRYGSVLLENTGKSAEEALREYDFGGHNSIEDVGLDNIEEFHAKLKGLMGGQGGDAAATGATGSKKFNFDTPVVKQKVVEIVNELSTIVTNSLATRLNDEVESNVGVSEYIAFLRHEIEELEQHNQIYNQPIYDAQEELNRAHAKVEQCRAELAKLEGYIDLLKRKHATYGGDRQAFKDKLLREIAIIQEIFGIYSNGLANVSDGLKQRIDDGLNNGHFQGTAHYDKRALHENYSEHADDLNSHVEAKAKALVGEDN